MASTTKGQRTDRPQGRGPQATSEKVLEIAAMLPVAGRDALAESDPPAAVEAAPQDAPAMPARGRGAPPSAAEAAGQRAASPHGDRGDAPGDVATRPAAEAAPSMPDRPADPEEGGAPAPAARPVSGTGAAAKDPAHPPAAGQAEATARPAAPDATAVAAATPDAPRAASAALVENIARLEGLSQRLMAALAERGLPNPGVEGPGPTLYVDAASAWMRTMAGHPGRLIEQQVNFWAETMKHVARAQDALLRGRLAAPDDAPPAGKDKRFANPLWRTHPFFAFVRRQYEINAEAMRAASAALDLPDPVARRRLDWLTAQMIDMMAPTNFLATNPDALERAIATEGESLVRGLENLVRDVEANGGELLVSLADRNAFTVGENIGTAPGRVVHRTPLFELIQYAPATETVHEIPVIIFPPWINKFYILDLKPENSLIRWVVGQGQTLFVVSWKNPDARYADTGMDDYVSAYLEAIDEVRRIAGVPQVNAVGYCIAGTTLSATLGLLHKRGDDRVRSATLFTTLTDFSDLGEFTTFLQDDFLGGIEAEVAAKGVFGAALMSRTMSFLRANDLVWGPAIRNYMMGETPPAFDLLFWNGDSTNLPGRMTLDYLGGLCQRNELAGEGFSVHGTPVTLADVTVPLCAVACETDHIAPWKDCWRGVAQIGSPDKRFILSESGHIAGIVNPPTKKKYGHYVSEAGFGGTFEDWKDGASFEPGSWWPRWGEWLAGHGGPRVPARHPGDGLDPAPGTYVHERAAG